MRTKLNGPYEHMRLVCLMSLVVAVLGCDDGDSTVGLSGESVSVDGEYRTSSSTLDDRPLRVLLVVDTSQSNEETDQDGHRVRAAADLVTQLSTTDRDISLGFIGFNTSATALSDGFLKLNPDNLAQITESIAGFGEAQGFTNYLAALDLAATMVLQDIKMVEEEIFQAEADGLDTASKKPWYFVLFVSDGFPKMPESGDLPQSTESIMFKVKQLVDIRSSAVLGITLHTAFLEGFDAEPTEEAKALLERMAKEGRGTFVNFTDEEAIDFSLFDFSVMPLAVIKEFVFFNRNSLLKDGRVLPDSDGDGLADVDEIQMGTDPLVVDSDGDHLGDGFEVIALLNPLAVDTICTNQSSLDSDGDGLNDCEELHLNLDPACFDSDGDGIVDGVELFGNADPTDGMDLDRDPDMDGMNTRQELLLRSDPQSADPPDADYLYRFAIQFLFDQVTGDINYQFVISNIWLTDTKATTEHQVGENELVIQVIECPRGDSRTHMLYGQTRRVSSASDLQGLLDFKPQDFKLISTQQLPDN